MCKTASNISSKDKGCKDMGFSLLVDLLLVIDFLVSIQSEYVTPDAK